MWYAVILPIEGLVYPKYWFHAIIYEGEHKRKDAYFLDKTVEKEAWNNAFDWIAHELEVMGMR